MKQYLDLVQHVLTYGTRKENRTGVDTLSTFNYNYEHNMQEGFPLLTTKEISWKNIVIENLWFLSGKTDIGILQRHGCKFWDPWADREGKVPSAYGNFWRHFPVHSIRDSSDIRVDGDPCLGYNDQISWVLNEMRKNPMSRRMIVSAWAPGNAQYSKLPPCHCLYIFNVQNDADGTKRLCLHLTQRSCDCALGIPYNLAGYAFLLQLFSQMSGLQPGIFAHTLVDAHVYTKKPDGTQEEYDHIPGLIEQCSRTPKALPKLIIDPTIRDLQDIEGLMHPKLSTEEVMYHFKLEGYDPDPAIKFKVAV